MERACKESARGWQEKDNRDIDLNAHRLLLPSVANSRIMVGSNNSIGVSSDRKC